ncbi:MFS transporter [Kitasatospora sp. NPDC047058]|uniref:MFS transporter n=1 Tax=Kitasatospora sp. NPDC047058 TaxID=3155620 RepID=UPI0033D8AEA7
MDGTPPSPPPAATMHRFWLLTLAAAVSKLGNTFLNLAMPWTLLADTGSPLLAALSLGVQNLPYVASPLLGGLIDRYERRRVFLVSELVQGVAVALIPLLLASRQIAGILVLLLVVGCASVVSNLTSDFSLVPALSPPARLAEAYSAYASTVSVARCVGPAVAGAVLATTGPAWALWIDAATFLVTAAVAVTLPKQPPAPAAAGFLTMLSEGFRSFRRLPGVVRLTVVLALYNLGAGSMPAIVVVLAKDAWHWSSGQAGLVLAAGAAGSALGAWLGPRVLAGASTARRVGCWFGVCTVACALLVPPWPALTVLGFFALMAGEGGMNVTTNEYRFRAIPDALTGRVNSIMRAFIVGATVLSSVLLGWSVDLSDQLLRLAPALIGAAAACAAWAAVRPEPFGATGRSEEQRA